MYSAIALQHDETSCARLVTRARGSGARGWRWPDPCATPTHQGVALASTLKTPHGMSTHVPPAQALSSQVEGTPQSGGRASRAHSSVARDPRLDPRLGNSPSGTYRAQQRTLHDEDLRVEAAELPSVEKDRFLLTVMTGPAKGSVFKLDKEVLTIGRADEADITIPDPGLSRLHARFTLVGHGPAVGFLINDLNSTNGSFVGGQEISKPTFLTDGVRISLGKRTVARFSVQDALEEQATLQLHDSALKDGLTGVYNRRVFDDRLEMEFAFAERHARPLSLIMLDVDHFKRFNDEHGHPAGDEALRAVARELVATLRVEDLVARYGGEEFVVLARDTLPSEAALVAERLRTIISQTPVFFQGQRLAVSASLGVASNFPSLSAASGLVDRADQALYEAKHTGRNRVAVYGASRRII